MIASKGKRDSGRRRHVQLSAKSMTSMRVADVGRDRKLDLLSLTQVAVRDPPAIWRAKQ